MSEDDLESSCVNTLRFLSVDAVQKAQSGHPGLPMGCAALAYVLWDRFLKYNPSNPDWPNRDRFVLSAGHGSALLYSLLHLTGFDLSLSELQNFRQWGSRTPGHPEYGKTPGVEATTGPLGQGFGNAVGMAIAEQALAARFNRPNHEILDHFTYALVSDGDLMEGISSEAASLAGHLKLGKLIVLYADNRISIEGDTGLAFTENVVARFKSYGWHAEHVTDGNDLVAIDGALTRAKNENEAPSLIAFHTHIGFGSPNKQDTSAAHGEPLGEEEVRLSKEKLGWPVKPLFFIPENVLTHFRKKIEQGKKNESAWGETFSRYRAEYSDLAREWDRTLAGRLPEDWDKRLPTFDATSSTMATRDACGSILNALAKGIPELIGGSADLAPSTKTLIEDGGDFEPGNRAGRNLHFGVREHAMGSILNGIVLHKGLISFGSTFLIFSDYMRPPMRLAAMNGLPVIYIFTHDSIGLGEDGPTHQPIEQLLGLRSIPGMVVLRPADANETRLAWKFALAHRDRPVALILTRQKLPVLDPISFPAISDGLTRGGYVLNHAPTETSVSLVLIATGSEVHLALEAQKKLAQSSIYARVVSLPCVVTFEEQPEAYRNEIVPKALPRLFIEAGISLGWRSYLDSKTDVVGIDHFGASADGRTNMKEFGFTVERVCRQARELLSKNAE